VVPSVAHNRVSPAGGKQTDMSAGTVLCPPTKPLCAGRAGADLVHPEKKHDKPHRGGLYLSGSGLAWGTAAPPPAFRTHWYRSASICVGQGDARQWSKAPAGQQQHQHSRKAAKATGRQVSFNSAPVRACAAACAQASVSVHASVQRRIIRCAAAGLQRGLNHRRTAH
jgi:hypothetical protein